MSEPLTLYEIESRLAAVDEALDEATGDFAVLSHAAAEAEADYKAAHARAFLAAASTDVKVSNAVAEARADSATADLLRAFKIADARRASAREALLSYRARLDALRTLNANVRAATH